LGFGDTNERDNPEILKFEEKHLDIFISNSSSSVFILSSFLNFKKKFQNNF
jgi:hypothetical protein